MSGWAAHGRPRPCAAHRLVTFHALGAVKRRHQGAADTSPPDRLAVERRAGAGPSTGSSPPAPTRSPSWPPLGRPAAASRSCRAAWTSTTSPPHRARPAGGAASVPSPARRPWAGWCRRKGFDTVIEALADLPDTELVIAGGGAGGAAIPSVSGWLALADAAAAWPTASGCWRRCPAPDMPALLRSADVVVCHPLVRAVRHRPAGGDGLRRAGRRLRRRRDARHRRARRHRAAWCRRENPGRSGRRPCGTARVGPAVLRAYGRAVPLSEPGAATPGTAWPPGPSRRTRSTLAGHRDGAHPAGRRLGEPRRLRRAAPGRWSSAGPGSSGPTCARRCSPRAPRWSASTTSAPGAPATSTTCEAVPGFTFVEHDVTEPLPDLGGFRSGVSPGLGRLAAATTSGCRSRRCEPARWAPSTRLQLAREHGARFVLASTSEVYGDPEVHPQAESYLGPRQPGRPAQRVRRGQAVRRGVDRGLPPHLRRGHRHRPDLQHLRAADAARRRPDGADLRPPGAGRRAAHGHRDRPADPFPLLCDRHRRRPARAGALGDEAGPINLGNPVEQTVLELAEQIAELVGSAAHRSAASRPWSTTRSSAAPTSRWPSRGSAGDRGCRCRTACIARSTGRPSGAAREVNHLWCFGSLSRGTALVTHPMRGAPACVCSASTRSSTTPRPRSSSTADGRRGRGGALLATQARQATGAVLDLGAAGAGDPLVPGRGGPGTAAIWTPWPTPTTRPWSSRTRAAWTPAGSTCAPRYAARAPYFLQTLLPDYDPERVPLRPAPRRPRRLGRSGRPVRRLCRAGGRRSGRGHLVAARGVPRRQARHPGRPVAAALTRSAVRGPDRPPRLRAVQRRVQGDGPRLLRHTPAPRRLRDLVHAGRRRFPYRRAWTGRASAAAPPGRASSTTLTPTSPPASRRCWRRCCSSSAPGCTTAPRTRTSRWPGAPRSTAWPTPDCSPRARSGRCACSRRPATPAPPWAPP